MVVVVLNPLLLVVEENRVVLLHHQLVELFVQKLLPSRHAQPKQQGKLRIYRVVGFLFEFLIHHQLVHKFVVKQFFLFFLLVANWICHIRHARQQLTHHKDGTHSNISFPVQIRFICCEDRDWVKVVFYVYWQVKQVFFPFKGICVDVNDDFISVICYMMKVFFMNTNYHRHKTLVGSFEHLEGQVWNIKELPLQRFYHGKQSFHQHNIWILVVWSKDYFFFLKDRR